MFDPESPTGRSVMMGLQIGAALTLGAVLIALLAWALS